MADLPTGTVEAWEVLDLLTSLVEKSLVLDRAIAQVERARDLDPSNYFPYYVLGINYREKGDTSAAISYLEKARRMADEPPVLGSLGDAYARAGRPAEARRLLAELQAWSRHRWVPPANIAWIQLALGDKDGAMNSLEAAYQTRSSWLNWLKLDHTHDPLRSDPRFIALIQKVGLAE